MKVPISISITQSRSILVEAPNNYTMDDLLRAAYREADIPEKENWIIENLTIEEEIKCF